VIGTLARRYAERGVPVEVVTGDRDLIQLVDDARDIRVLYTGRGVRRVAVLDDAAVREAHGVPPQQYAQYAILRGDPSDGLPGIPGVGARTAAGLLERFGDLAGVRRAAVEGESGIRPGIAAALRESGEYLDRAERVVTVAEVPLPEVDPGLPREPADAAALEALSVRWGLAAPIGRLRAAIGQALEPGGQRWTVPGTPWAVAERRDGSQRRPRWCRGAGMAAGSSSVSRTVRLIRRAWSTHS
jgi:hypothetical protein